MSQFNRRNFLVLAAGSFGAIFLNQCAKGQTKEQIFLPKLHKSIDGLLNVNLEASYRQVNLANQPASLLTYNGQIPAPRLEAKPGDTVKINFRNNLSQPSNLHYHGLHIPPTGTADNVWLEIPPGENFTYEFTIPKNHPAGTFWYHPHLHHLTAEQVFGGLAGLFIIGGELDEIPEIKAAKEEFLVLKDFDLDRNGRIIQPHHRMQMMGREGQLLTVNGAVNPNIFLPKGGLLRLRLVNASASRFYRLTLEEHPFYLIATDGGSISQPVELTELLLSPGERAELLIKGDRPAKEYRLLNLPYNRGGMGMMGGGMMGGGMMGGNQNNPNPQTLATLIYKGTTSPVPLPEKLISVETLPEPKIVRQIEFNMAMSPGQGMIFLFNGKAFDPQRIDTEVNLNTVEDWELINLDPDRMDHPFHLHINHFQVISRNGQPAPYSAWKDTVLVRGGDTVRIRIPFKDFPGKTVYHCHVLDHEDLGMMGTVNIRPLA